MCNQTVCLVQAALERVGITTVSLSLLRDVAATLRPPRVLSVPFPFGFPLGEPQNPALQRRVIAQALALLPRNDVPVLEDFAP
jgi:hypothetical protein